MISRETQRVPAKYQFASFKRFQCISFTLANNFNCECIQRTSHCVLYYTSRDGQHTRNMLAPISSMYFVSKSTLKLETAISEFGQTMNLICIQFHLLQTPAVCFFCSLWAAILLFVLKTRFDCV